MSKSTLYVRPSGILAYESCGFAYYLQYVLKIRPKELSNSLAFGAASHKALLPYVVAHGEGETVDTVRLFEEAWDEQLDNHIVEFTSYDEEELRTIGKKLAESFPSAWNAMGLRVVVANGVPMVEQRLRLPLGEDIVLTGEPDIIASRVGDPRQRLAVPDLKLARSAAFDGFALLSDQLTAYNLLVHFRRPELGLQDREISEIGFLEGLKKKGAEWHAPQMVPARTERQMGEYVSKVHMTAALIRKGYFPKRSGAAYNTPCDTCDLRKLCLKGSTEGMVSSLGDVEELVRRPVEEVMSGVKQLPEAA